MRATPSSAARDMPPWSSSAGPSAIASLISPASTYASAFGVPSSGAPTCAIASTCLRGLTTRGLSFIPERRGRRDAPRGARRAARPRPRATAAAARAVDLARAARGRGGRAVAGGRARGRGTTLPPSRPPNGRSTHERKWWSTTLPSEWPTSTARSPPLPSTSSSTVARSRVKYWSRRSSASALG